MLNILGLFVCYWVFPSPFYSFSTHIMIAIVREKYFLGVLLPPYVSRNELFDKEKDGKCGANVELVTSASMGL